MSVNIQPCSRNLRNQIRELHHSSERETRRQFMMEGLRANSELLRSGVLPEIAVVITSAPEATVGILDKWQQLGVPVYSCSEKEMGLMADVIRPQDVLAVYPFRNEEPLGQRTVLLDNVVDPGNVGTIIRTAAWFGWTDVVLSERSADLYNPKVARSTAGALSRINVWRKKNLVHVLEGIRSNRTVIAAVATGGSLPHEVHAKDDVVLIVGSEAHGISESVAVMATHNVTIGGGNGVESLNAAVAAAILMHEVLR